MVNLVPFPKKEELRDIQGSQNKNPSVLRKVFDIPKRYHIVSLGCHLVTGYKVINVKGVDWREENTI